MKRQSPAVREYMTHLPVELERCESTGEAEALMKQRGIHHLPVMNGAQLVGIVTERAMLEGRIRLGNSFACTSLEELCEPELMTVSPVDPVAMVATQLLEQSTDHAAVMDGGFVVGILTVTDVLRFVKDYFGVGLKA